MLYIKCVWVSNLYALLQCEWRHSYWWTIWLCNRYEKLKWNLSKLTPNKPTIKCIQNIHIIRKFHLFDKNNCLFWTRHWHRQDLIQNRWFLHNGLLRRSSDCSIIWTKQIVKNLILLGDITFIVDNDPFLLLLSFNKQIVITTRSSSSYHLINK